LNHTRVFLIEFFDFGFCEVEQRLRIFDLGPNQLSLYNRSVRLYRHGILGPNQDRQD
jgi:hypothetical protein